MLIVHTQLTVHSSDVAHPRAVKRAEIVIVIVRGALRTTRQSARL